jgi:hypothetical protein
MVRPSGGLAAPLKLCGCTRFEKQHARPVEEAASVPNKPSLVPERLSNFTEQFGVSE